jgi:hypothetical protein
METGTPFNSGTKSADSVPPKITSIPQEQQARLCVGRAEEVTKSTLYLISALRTVASSLVHPLVLR